jgi:hypothetical protein
MFTRALALLVFWLMATVAWVILGGTTADRTQTAQWELSQGVSELWGEPLVQRGPVLRTSWKERSEREEPVAGSTGRPRRSPSRLDRSLRRRRSTCDDRERRRRSDLRQGLLVLIHDLTSPCMDGRKRPHGCDRRRVPAAPTGRCRSLRRPARCGRAVGRAATRDIGRRHRAVVDLPIEPVCARPSPCVPLARARHGRTNRPWRGTVEAFQPRSRPTSCDLDFPPGTMSPPRGRERRRRVPHLGVSRP